MNRVVAESDPTWHGEVAAIRDACKKLGTVNLEGAELSTAGERRAMCYAASFWARVGRTYYAATIADARQYGDFDDDAIDANLKLPNAERSVPVEQMMHGEMVDVWKKFQVMPDRARY